MSKSFMLFPILAAGGLVLVAGCTMPGDRAPSYAGGRAHTASAQPLSATMVQQVQARLQQLGMYNGNVDGMWGPATEASVRTFQQSQGMAPTGQLDSPTLSAMNLSGATSQPLSSPQPPPPSMGTR